MQTTFNVSNTDVITMLVVKQRELLEKREQTVLKEFLEESVKINNQGKELYKKRLEKVDKTIVEGFRNLFKALNPKIKFEIQIGESDFYIDLYRNRQKIYNYYDDSINIYAIVDEKDEEKVVTINNNGDTYLKIPFKMKFSVKITDKYYELSKELGEIRSLLKNEARLKEKLIAQVTENALKSLPEMQTLVNNVELIALN